MTILIGYRFNNGVLITADRKTNDIDKEGNNLGTSYRSTKIIHIRPNIIIATAGLGTIVRTTAKLVRSLISHKETMSVKDALKLTQECFSFVYQKFKENNPDVSYDNMYVMLGGFNFDKNEPFLYELKSSNNFSNNNDNHQSLVIGSKQDLLVKYIEDNMEHYSNDKYPELFSAAIRSIETDNASKETQSVFSFVENGNVCINEIFIDENGLRHNPDN